MKSVIAIGFALLLAGCASGPYYSGYGSYSYYDPYPVYSYGYSPYYYGAPVIGGSFFYYDRDDHRRHGDWRDGRWRDRDRDDDRPRWRDRDRGNDASPDLFRPGNAARGRGEAGNESGM